MPLSYQDCVSLLAQLAEEEDLRVTIRSSAWGGVLTGLATFIGGVAMGPPGLLLGGTLGGGASYAMSQGKFRSAAEVLRELPPHQQRQLANNVRQLISRLRTDDLIVATAMLAGGMTDLRGLLITQVASFLTNELAMQVVSQ